MRLCVEYSVLKLKSGSLNVVSGGAELTVRSGNEKVDFFAGVSGLAEKRAKFKQK